MQSPDEGFPPVANKKAKILILGTLPGQASLIKQEYYGKKQNAFWPIMAKLLGFAPDLPYRQRLEKLLEHRIALWDVCASAIRKGSLDAAIEPQSVVPNALPHFIETHRDLELIVFNGQPAEKLFRKWIAPDLSEAAKQIPSLVLPSTSPAHARLSLDEKRKRWAGALLPFLQT